MVHECGHATQGRRRNLGPQKSDGVMAREEDWLLAGGVSVHPNGQAGADSDQKRSSGATK